MTNPEDVHLRPKTQSREIGRLGAEISQLKSASNSVLAIHRPEANIQADSLRSSETIAQVDDRRKLLEIVFIFIKSAPPQEAQDIVRQIRANRALEDVIAYATECRERWVASPDEAVAAWEPRERTRREDEESTAGIAQRNHTLEHLPLPHGLEREGETSSARKSNLPKKGKAAVWKTQSRGLGWRQGALSLVWGQLVQLGNSNQCQMWRIYRSRNPGARTLFGIFFASVAPRDPY
jgi:hypothetical protein